MTRALCTIGVDQPLSLAHRVMRENNLRHLPVLDQGKLVGLVSERDLALIEASRRLDVDEVAVEKAMTANPYCVAPDASLVEVARQMATRRYGAAIVVDGVDVVGIFTSVDALLALAHVLDRSLRSRTHQVAP
jgi:acetoin utilization protein AcuB